LLIAIGIIFALEEQEIFQFWKHLQISNTN
jgi:hypothetical protein